MNKKSLQIIFTLLVAWFFLLGYAIFYALPASADTIIPSSVPAFTGNGSYWKTTFNDSVKQTHAGIVFDYPSAYRMESITLRACVDGGANPAGYFGVYVGNKETGNIGSRSTMPLRTFANPITSIASTTNCISGFSDYTLVLETPLDILPSEKVALISCDSTLEDFSCYDDSVYATDSTQLRYEGGVNNYNNRFYGFCYGFTCGTGTVYEFATSAYAFQPAFRVNGYSIIEGITPPNFDACTFSGLNLGDCAMSLLSYTFIPPEGYFQNEISRMTTFASTAPFSLIYEAGDVIDSLFNATLTHPIEFTLPFANGYLTFFSSDMIAQVPYASTFRTVITWGLYLSFFSLAFKTALRVFVPTSPI